MLRPFFDHSPKGEKVEYRGMHINYGESGLEVIEEMVDLLYDVVLELLPKVGVIPIG